jgi:hypothetical protein
MSYYNCSGPFVKNGIRHEGFTPQQIKLIQSCWQVPLSPNRRLLVDACAGKGGDIDHDGICDADDACIALPNNTPAELADIDGDGIPNDCDNCSTVWNADQSDIDGDGKGDACDDDRDGDGCPNAVDQHPDQSWVKIGTYVSPTCPDGNGGVRVRGSGLGRRRSHRLRG